MKGKWIQISPAFIYRCSQCGQQLHTGDIEVYKFCHGCGADMRKEVEQPKKTTNLDWLRTLSAEEVAIWFYDEWLDHMQYMWTSSQGGLVYWLNSERDES